MTTEYWDQWNLSDIMSMHGVEVDACHDEDQCDDQNDRVEGEEQCCSGCMKCLGLSWSDFV